MLRNIIWNWLLLEDLVYRSVLTNIDHRVFHHCEWIYSNVEIDTIDCLKRRSITGLLQSVTSLLENFNPNQYLARICIVSVQSTARTTLLQRVAYLGGRRKRRRRSVCNRFVARCHDAPCQDDSLSGSRVRIGVRSSTNTRFVARVGTTLVPGSSRALQWNICILI